MAGGFGRSGLVVAIDGPSGTGKSSVSKAIARTLGVGYVDTGATYRALTWWCLDQGIDLADAEAVVSAAASLPLQLGTDPDAVTVRVSGTDVSAAIRVSRVTTQVSVVATNRGVRPILQDLQRRLIGDCVQRTGGCVAEGRDVTTVVAPDARVRILLTASDAARVARRAQQLHGSTAPASLESTHGEVVGRDAQDSTVSDFTQAAPGVTSIDTSSLTLQQAIDAVLAVVRSA